MLSAICEQICDLRLSETVMRLYDSLRRSSKEGRPISSRSWVPFDESIFVRAMCGVQSVEGLMRRSKSAELSCLGVYAWKVVVMPTTEQQFTRKPVVLTVNSLKLTVFSDVKEMTLCCSGPCSKKRGSRSRQPLPPLPHRHLSCFAPTVSRTTT